MTDQTIETTTENERETWPALIKGFRGKCPNCGEGKLLHSYLKVNDSCSNCGQELFHNRSDDGPAYLTILLVGHLLAPALHVSYVNWRPDPWAMALGFSVACIALSLFLLPRLKGAVVAYQWARRMHGLKKPRDPKRLIRLDKTPDKTAIRDASTVIVLRDRWTNPSILMGQRGSKRPSCRTSSCSLVVRSIRLMGSSFGNSIAGSVL